MPSVPTLEAIADREAIRDVLARYCRGIDRLDFDLIRSSYHPDASDERGPHKEDVEGLIRGIRVRHQYIEESMHVLGNCLIEIDGPVALVETYCTSYSRFTPDAPISQAGPMVGLAEKQAEKLAECARLRLTAVLRYVDRFEKREGDWRIARRTVVMEDAWPLLHDAEVPDPSQWVVARRDRRDHIWTARAGVLEGSAAP